MKKLLFLFVLLTYSVVFVAQDEEILYLDIPPSFPGGEKVMTEYIKSRLVYPHSALDNKVEGRVILRFIVTESGYLDSIKVVKGLHPACDSVAISIVKRMPRWISGTDNGTPVPVYYTLPIIFRLPDKNIKTVCEVMPRFSGGMDSMSQFINRNLKYPVRGDYCIHGRVVIRFIVTKEGKVKDPVIRRGIEYYFDEEALRVIRLMPDWEPAMHNGEKVDCYFIIPLLFNPPR